MNPNNDAIHDDDLQTFPPGKDEMNFAEFPPTLLTDRVPKGQTCIEYEDRVYDEKSKKMIPQRRIIQASEKYGLPTASDNLVIMALIQLTKQNGNFATPEVEFSRLELLRLLGWKDEGGNYKRIKDSLLRLKSVNYIYDNAWWDKLQGKWTTRAFSILDNVEINDSRSANAQGTLFPSRIKWNEVVFGSFQAGYLRDIDFKLCMKLQHPTALALYRFLGKRFYFKTELTFDLKELSQKHVGLARKYEGGTQLSRKLKPAIRELEEVGFLVPLTDAERFTKKGRQWSIRFVKKLPELTCQTTPPIQPSPPTQPAGEPKAIPPLVLALTERGVGSKAAARLVAKHSSEAIQLQLENLDWHEKKEPGRINNPGPWLVTAIEEGHIPPKGFESSADRQKREQAQRSNDGKDAENQRRKREEDLRTGQVAAYWMTMTAEAQAAFSSRALAQADASVREAYEQTKPRSIKKIQLVKIVNNAIRRQYGMPPEPE